jgi:4-amino-4-deoxy-L-arabinose transferase-like glycosyltransferase
VSRRALYPALAAVCALPRLGVLLHERGAITANFTEKSDTFAQTFVAHGTYGFLAGKPSAYTQPLYGWFLIPVYWLAGRSWLSIGLAQIVLAVVTAWLVFEIGRRLGGTRVGLLAAMVATVNPYLVWHDMHVNREIVDQVCAAALVLLTLVVAERPSKKLAALLGVVAGLAMLGNTRLVFLPVLCAGYLLWRLPRGRAAALAAALVLAGAAVTVAPWIARNKAGVGCWAITTDGRALWKANNPQTYSLLARGEWIDNVSPIPRPAPPNADTPEEAWGYVLKGRPDVAYRVYPNECVQMRFYEDRAFSWMADHPGAKAQLAALSAKLLWQPSVFETTGRNGAGTSLDFGRGVAEPVYMWLLYVLAAAGLLLAPRRFAVLAVLLFAYQTACAAFFVGATRYRVAWDFLLALLAAAALERALAWALARRRAGEEPLGTTS